jgi:hypothetical protein
MPTILPLITMYGNYLTDNHVNSSHPLVSSKIIGTTNEQGEYYVSPKQVNRIKADSNIIVPSSVIVIRIIN